MEVFKETAEMSFFLFMYILLLVISNCCFYQKKKLQQNLPQPWLDALFLLS